MKRLWVRPKQICLDSPSQKEGEFFLTHACKDMAGAALSTR